SLKEQVSRKRYKCICKPRKEKPVYEGRLYKDLMDLLNEDADIRIAEMDTLMNSPQGPYIQTIIFTGAGFMIGYIHKQKTAASMASTFDTLESILGGRLFSLLLGIVLTDRGPEFETFDLFEKSSDGSTRCNIFYCDPMQSSQKPHVENNHNYVRDIIPNGYPLDGITQDDLNLAFSHINSVPRKSFGGKTPYEVFTFLYGEETASILNIECIARDDVTLKPSLLRHAFKRNKD
ncbi:MAG: helix-turn-helix domain containing protein, partial [Clostridia bacterium]|nr:helix-turn-helix domain containing protein [Clostridia bacterium]